jgi:LPXTG-motif cell wall-anchored protein
MITATGQIHFGGGKIKAMSPKGIQWGAPCQDIAIHQPRANPWPLSGASCWSLIAKVGTGPPFEIGVTKTFRAAHPGELRLGLNDNFVDDNTGAWAATIAVTAGPTTPTTPAATSGSTKSSNTVVFVLIGVAVLALLLLLFWARRRTKHRGAATELPPAGETSGDPALTPALAPLLAEGQAGGTTLLASAPPETDSIDVNIFEVEFSNGLTLRVGYNHFPEGTELRWAVSQSRVPAASGSFVTKGGGSTNHVETIPLGVKLEGRQSQPTGADVQFDWSINGVPFRYSVRRDTNC